METPKSILTSSAVGCLLVLSTLLFSCKGNRKPDSVDQNSTKKLKQFRTSCYRAVDGKDTAYLKLELLSKDTVAGDLTINYFKKPKNEGNFKGMVVGDTLFVDYTFDTGNKFVKYTNPLALLKNNGNLILGVGEIKTYLGRSYLDKKEKINFEKGRFIFKVVPCS